MIDFAEDQLLQHRPSSEKRLEELLLHTVQQGECLKRIADKYGFRDFQTIYRDSQNSAFRKLRPDPNTIFPGDTLFIPEKMRKTQARITGSVHIFKVPSPKRWLKLALRDWEGEPLAKLPYELVVEDSTFKGVTDAHGNISQEVPLHAENGELEIDGRQWPIAIAHLNPVADTPDQGVTGIQGRLQNLGYHPGPIDGQMGPKTRRAIRAFQKDHPPLEVNGISGEETKNKIIAEYGW